ncbi:MAG: FkbM family methyltransferase [Bacteroidota bacterium]
MAKITHTLKRKLFTNKMAEGFFISLINMGFKRAHLFLPNNTDYPKNTLRKARRDNSYFLLDISDYQEYLTYFKLESDSSQPLLKYIRKQNGILLDIGANIGQTSLWISNFLAEYDVKIYAFEPYPKTFEKLKANVSLNNNRRIILQNVALGSESQLIEMVEECATNSGGFRPRGYREQDQLLSSIQVQQRTLDSYTGVLDGLFFIKIDVEGYELEVLKGAREVLLRYKPTLFIELIDANLKKQKASAAGLIAYLRELGYSQFVNSTTEQVILENQLDKCHFDVVCS